MGGQKKQKQGITTDPGNPGHRCHEKGIKGFRSTNEEVAARELGTLSKDAKEGCKRE